MTYSINVTLQGETAEVRERLDDLLDLLHEFAVFVDRTERGATLQAGRQPGLFDEQRWSALCKRVRSGQTKSLAIDHNAFQEGHLHSAFFVSGLTQAGCWVRLNDEVIGSQIALRFTRGEDHAITADEFRQWVGRIEHASGMSRQVDIERAEPPKFQPAPDWVHDVLRRVAEIEPAIPTPPSEHAAGIAIGGWDRLCAEMELAIIGGASLDGDQRTALEELLRTWVDHGTEHGYGDGFFHGWLPGEWEDDEYLLGVDSGSQDVDWSAAITDLAERLAAAGPPFATALAIRLGPPLSE